LLENEGYEDVSAGLYTYALEEFGIYLLYKNCKNVVNDTKKVIIYRKEFADHDIKFKTVFDFLQNDSYEGYPCCMLINKKMGGFSPHTFSWKSY
jgi:hypothetical protein